MPAVACGRPQRAAAQNGTRCGGPAFRGYQGRCSSLAQLLLCISRGSSERCIGGDGVMIWILIRVFLITPLVFVLAAPVVLAVSLHAAFGSR
jgi:hypothetical protein